ncbi:MAG: T9SS type A sorting domain-containing protein [Flavobacterium sp.]|nr:MAG: T9SS type A sorting domain-containing protein [Flavobacterium sp.]
MRTLLLLICLACCKSFAQSGPSLQSDSDTIVSTRVNGKISRKPVGLDLMGGNRNGVTVFPNQANDHLIISSRVETGSHNEVTMISSSGQPVMRLHDVRENTLLVDVSGLNRGLYFIEVRSAGNIFRTKWIRQ